ncbi:hypothetical protein AGMMS50239_35170 [Bacteroidia bacterium]|nr:hypothetical protein AGMMS50239_35170 [Bacteroidia bacterium]
MKFSFLDKIIQKLGRDKYHIDEKISFYNMTIIIFEKLFEVIRGCFLKLFMQKSKGIIFLGTRTKIKHTNLISSGKSLYIGDNVYINALSKKGVQFGNNVSIHRNSIIDCTGGIRNIGEGIVIGNNVGFSPDCYIQVRGNVTIGNNVIFGPGVKIFSESHNFFNADKFINEQGETRKGVIIENGVWIGADATILDGVRIGENSIVAAKSLVNKDVLAYSIVAGIPAKVIKNRTMK